MKLTALGNANGSYESFTRIGWTDEMLVQHGYAYPDVTDDDPLDHARLIVENIVRFYREKGFVITVDEDKVSVRPVRK